jgi:hypothetical protein
MARIKYTGKNRLKLNDHIIFEPGQEKEVLEKTRLYLLNDETYCHLFEEITEEKVLQNKVTKKLKEK